ncbi:MAG: hypothetical protein ACOX2O_07650 [Bdellovibrionota bacterium]|jgi:hypothetical protein
MKASMRASMEDDLDRILREAFKCCKRNKELPEATTRELINSLARNSNADEVSSLIKQFCKDSSETTADEFSRYLITAILTLYKEPIEEIDLLIRDPSTLVECGRVLSPLEDAQLEELRDILGIIARCFPENVWKKMRLCD